MAGRVTAEHTPVNAAETRGSPAAPRFLYDVDYSASRSASAAATTSVAL
ncbi:hypothetical protein M2352_000129 [Azospirillum fermentarium]|nr:hypothetical protein [Azospirillum fermentarium]